MANWMFIGAVIIIGIIGIIAVAALVMSFLLWFGVLKITPSKSNTTSDPPPTPAGVLTVKSGPYPTGADGALTYTGHPAYTTSVSGTPPAASYCSEKIYAQWSYSVQYIDGHVEDSHGAESEKVGFSVVDLVFDPDNLPASGRSILHTLTIPPQENKKIVNNDKIMYNLYARYDKAITTAGALVTPSEWVRVARVSSVDIYTPSDQTMTITEEADRVLPRSFCNS